MDDETQKSMRFFMLVAAASFAVSIIAFGRMSLYSPISSYADYENFIRYIIVGNMIQFISMTVLLVFFVNDAGELENFTKKGPLEKSWLINTIGVLILIGAGILIGYALVSLFTGWTPIPDPSVIFLPAWTLLTAGMLCQALGFSVPVLYFLVSKNLAKGVIPFKNNELLSDKIGIIFAVLLPLPSAILFGNALGMNFTGWVTLFPGILGIVTSAVGVVWFVLYSIAIKTRNLPEVPEDFKDKKADQK